MYALIQKSDNTILRIAPEAPTTLSDAKPFYWVDCPEGCALNWSFDGVTFTAPPGPTVAELKAQKRAEINARRDAKEAEGFYYNGVLFDSDQRSANRISFAALAAQAALAAGQEFNVDWTAADNSVVPLDAAGVIGLAVALAQYGAINFYTAKALKAQVEAAATPEEVATVPLP